MVESVSSDIVCCADSETSGMLAAVQRQPTEVATKLGNDQEDADSWLAGIEIHGDALKARLAHKLRRLAEQHASLGPATSER